MVSQRFSPVACKLTEPVRHRQGYDSDARRITVEETLDVLIRRGRLDDEPHIREFTKHTFRFGDYVGDAFAGWLESGCDVWIAEAGGIPVGVVCVDYPAPREAWFQGMRVHPDYRRRGIATMLTETCIKGARERGAHVARAIIDSDNYRSIGLVTSLGFRQVAEIIEFDVYPELLIPYGKKDEPDYQPHYELDCGRYLTSGLAVTRLNPSDAPEAWSLAKNDVRYIGTCYGQWISLSPDTLQRKAAEGYIIVARTESREIVAGALLDDWYEDHDNERGRPELEQEMTSFFGSVRGIRALLHHAAVVLYAEASKRGGIPCRLRPSVEKQSPALEKIRQIAMVENARREASPAKRQGLPVIETGDVMLLWEYPLGKK